MITERARAVAQERRDWLDVLRGELPAMVPAGRESPSGRSMAVLGGAFAYGLLAGLVTGAVCGGLVVARAPVLLLLAVPIGAAVGVLVSIVPSIVLGAAITVLAAHAHTPLCDPRRFHRDVWLVLLAGIAVLYALALVTATGDVPWPAILAVPTAVVVLMLRWAARRIVVAHAEHCGWLTLD